MPLVTFNTTADDDAARITAVLEALGFDVHRDTEPGAPGRIEWLTEQLAQRHRLTTHERQVLELVLVGSTNAEIAEQLELGRPTVKFALHGLYAKMGAEGREGILRAALLGARPPAEEPDVRPLEPSTGAGPAKTWL